MTGLLVALSVLACLATATPEAEGAGKRKHRKGKKMATCDIEIPAGGTALAEAVQKAASGARLCLQPGEHVAGLVLGKSLTLIGVAGADKTVLKGPGRGAVLRIEDDGLAIRIEGVTLTGGVSDAGGGLDVLGRGKVVVTDTRFVANQAGMVGGGGLYARGGLLTLERCAFERNQGRQGGAVFLDQALKADLTKCTFTDNEAELGGAVRLAEGVEVVLKASRLAQSKSKDGASLRVSGTKSRAPKVEMLHCEVADGELINGPEIPGVIQVKNSKLPASWKGKPGLTDEGGNTWKN